MRFNSEIKKLLPFWKIVKVHLRGTCYLLAPGQSVSLNNDFQTPYGEKICTKIIQQKYLTN